MYLGQVWYLTSFSSSIQLPNHNIFGFHLLSNSHPPNITIHLRSDSSCLVKMLPLRSRPSSPTCELNSPATPSPCRYLSHLPINQRHNPHEFHADFQQVIPLMFSVSRPARWYLNVLASLHVAICGITTYLPSVHLSGFSPAQTHSLQLELSALLDASYQAFDALGQTFTRFLHTVHNGR